MRWTAIPAGIVLLALASGAQAGGILLQELANPRNGVAQAGQAAYAYDAATAFYNPAGMVRLEESEVMLGVQPAWVDVEFETGSKNTTPGTDGGQQGGFVPGLGGFYTRPINDRWAAGFSLVGIAGGALNPDSDWVGRFSVTELSLVALGFNPSVGFRINEWLSIGGGVQANYGVMDMKLRLPRAGNFLDGSVARDKLSGVPAALERAVRSELRDAGMQIKDNLPPRLPEFISRLPPEVQMRISDRIEKEIRSELRGAKSELQAALGPAVNKIARARDVLRPGPEGDVEIDSADDWAFSWNLGLLIEPIEGTRFGISYRSEIDFDLTGDFNVKNTPPLFQALGVTDGNVASEIPIPQLVRVSGYHQLTDTIAIMGDVGWEDWSVMDFTPLTGPAGRTLAIERNWHDTWHFGLGVEWQAFPNWMFQAGVAHDTSPISKREFNLPDMPVDRQWRFSVGLVHDFREKLSIGVNYTYADLGRSAIDYSNAFSRTQGEYVENQAHFVAVSFAW